MGALSMTELNELLTDLEDSARVTLNIAAHLRKELGLSVPEEPNKPPVELTLTNLAIDYGVGVVEMPGANYKIEIVSHLPPGLNKGRHNLFIDVVDKNGERVKGVAAGYSWEGMRQDETRGLYHWTNPQASTWVIYLSIGARKSGYGSSIIELLALIWPGISTPTMMTSMGQVGNCGIVGGITPFMCAL